MYDCSEMSSTRWAVLKEVDTPKFQAVLLLSLRDNAFMWCFAKLLLQEKPWVTQHIKRESISHHTVLGDQSRMLQRRMRQHNEAIHDYHNDVVRMYGILQNPKNHTDEEIEAKLADGLTGELFEDVQLINQILLKDRKPLKQSV